MCIGIGRILQEYEFKELYLFLQIMGTFKCSTLSVQSNKHCEILVSCSDWVDWIDFIHSVPEKITPS